MKFIWDFSISNAIFTAVLITAVNWFLYWRLIGEFSRDLQKLMTAPVVEGQLTERLGRIEEMIARLIAKDDLQGEQIEKLRHGPDSSD